MTTTVDDRIRDAFAFRAAHTAIARDPAAAFDDTANVRVCGLSPRRPHSRQPMAVAAAIVAAGLVGGVVVQFGPGSDPATPTVPPGASPVQPAGTGNALAIDLDAIARTRPGPIGDGITYEVLDTAAMVASGWTVSQEAAYTGLFGEGPTPDAYRVQASLEGSGGATFGLTIERGWGGPQSGPDDRIVDVGGIDGRILTPSSGDVALPTIEWQRDDRLVRLSALRLDTSDVDLVAAATRLRFAERDELPVRPDTPPSIPARSAGAGAAELAGTLDGVAWTADVDESTLRSMTVTFDGLDYGGGFSSDRDNQPTDDPATDTNLTIVGVPGHGAVAVGFAPPAAANVRVIVDGDDVVTVLPMYRRPGESFFAVPIPDGLAVARLLFADEAGKEIASREIPSIPVGFGGTVGLD